ncbi:hypothetical protein ALC60_11622, partial [Trachymyrmex zeteki]
KQMDRPKEHYYKFNRFLLSVSGLWPYQSEWSAHLMRAVITIVMLSSAFFQISSMFTSEVTLDFIVDGIPCLLLTLGSLTNLYPRMMHIDKFRELFERMWQDWELQKTNHEIKIMHEHAEISRLFTFYYIILTYINIVGYNIWMFIPEILDIMSPMNESRPRRRPFNIEFFVDEEQYFYFIRFHICLVLIIVPIVYVASSTLFLTLTQHICGMCELLGHIDFDESYVNPVFQILSISDTERAIRSVGIFCVALCYVFISCYMGQRITDTSSSLCGKIFNSTWYNAVVSEQKALLIIMIRRYQPFILTACKFYVMSLQNFGMILQTAISYCMFIRQI